MKTQHSLQALVPLVIGLAACSASQPPPREASSPAPVEAFVRPAPGPYGSPAPDPIVTPDRPVTPQLRASMATPEPSPRRGVEPLVEASGPLTEPQRAVLGAVALCLQRAVEKGAPLPARALLVNVTVETSGVVSAVDLEGASAKLEACAEPEIRRVRYPSTDDSGGVRVVQYPIDASIDAAKDADAADE